jgi:CDP-glucose 4,6-dehydratase
VFVTGHTGFKGSWLAYWLLEMGAEVAGYALEPDTEPALFSDLGLAGRMESHIGDVRDAGHLARCLAAHNPEFVFHLAAQPLVRRSYAEPHYTLDVNVMGTANLLEAVRECGSVRVVVNVTTDKIYANPETGVPFREQSPLGGRDVYSASKACSELVTAAYRDSFFSGEAASAAIATARAGNVVGGGDWAADRIVPDIVRALVRGVSVEVRNPDAVRPWQHVLEPLGGYLALAAHLAREGSRDVEAVNFGPDPVEHHTVRDVVERAIDAWSSGSWRPAELETQPHEAGVLRLDTGLARELLGWVPVWTFAETIDRTVSWYRGYAEDPSAALELCRADIRAYETAFRAR